MFDLALTWCLALLQAAHKQCLDSACIQLRRQGPRHFALGLLSVPGFPALSLQEMYVALQNTPGVPSCSCALCSEQISNISRLAVRSVAGWGLAMHEQLDA